MDSILDAEEFLQLSSYYTDKEDYPQAIKIAKEGSTAFPEDGKLCYLLGALHAQIGMYDKAKAEMLDAVEKNPTLITAHFQLGLLHFTSGEVDTAKQRWQALDELSKNHPLQLFREGMLALAQDDFVLCKDKLQQGIELNLEIPALNSDMQKVIDSLDTPKDHSADTNNTAKFLLSSYENH